MVAFGNVMAVVSSLPTFVIASRFGLLFWFPTGNLVKKELQVRRLPISVVRVLGSVLIIAATLQMVRSRISFHRFPA